LFNLYLISVYFLTWYTFVQQWWPRWRWWRWWRKRRQWSRLSVFLYTSWQSILDSTHLS